MRKAKRTILIAMLICAGFVPTGSARTISNKIKLKHPTVSELLDKYAENADKMKSIIFKEYTLAEVMRTYSTPGQPAMKRKVYSEDEHRLDDKRGFWSYTRWGNVAPGGKWLDKGDVYGSRLYDGKSFYQHGKSRNSKTYPNGRVYLTRSKVEKGSIQLATESTLLGFDPGNNGRIDKVLRQGRRVSVRERMEKVGGSNCYVIDAVTRYGRQTVWIDPERGHNVRKLVISRRPGDKNGYLTLKKGQKYDYRFEVQRFKKVVDAWIPEQYSCRMARYFNPKDVHSGKTDGKLIEVTLNPDHDALGSFSPDDVQNGAVVSIIGVERKTFTWRDGKVVDALGQVILDSGPAPKQPAAPADAKEVLRRFTESRKNLNSFIVKDHEKCTYTYSGFNGIGTSYMNLEYRYDGNRVKNITYHWGDIGPRDRDVKEEDAHYYSDLWDGETAYSFTKSETHNKGIGTLKMSDKDNPGKYSKIAPDAFRKTHFGEVMGYHRGDDVRIGELFLRPSTKLQLRGERNNVNGVDCYVVEADVPEYGKYTVWIDPVHDFHIARIRVLRESGDHVYKQMLREKAIQKELYEVLEFEKKGDAWFPKTCKMKKAHNSVEHQSSWEKEFSFSMITLNPDHDALGSFLPDDIPNGCDVRLLSLPPSKKFVWRDGKVVDKDGREVDVDKLIKDESEKVKNPKPKRK